MPKFEKGHPGGPGRPRGSRNKVNLLLDRLAVGDETMAKTVIKAALSGDRAAARQVLKRIWSAPKGRALQFDLPEIRTPADLLAAHACVAAAISDGRLTAQDVASLSAGLEKHRRAFELAAVAADIEELKVRRCEHREALT